MDSRARFVYDQRMKTKLFLVLAALAAAVAPAVTLADPPRGAMPVRLTYNPNPNSAWAPGELVVLSADVRRNPALGQEDIFFRHTPVGSFPRGGPQIFDVSIPGVRAGEKIIVQGYMCSKDSTDCYPSDKDNPPSCSVEVRVLGGFRPKCQPVFTWTGGGASGGVLCSAECR